MQDLLKSASSRKGHESSPPVSAELKSNRAAIVHQFEGHVNIQVFVPNAALTMAPVRW